MFALLLQNLHAQNICVGLSEWLSFLKGIQMGLAIDLSSLHGLGRTILCTSEAQFDGYDIAWDTGHGNIHHHRDLANQCDQGIAALIRDLKHRGLLDETLVIWGGEFGRAPTSEGTKGRDHDHYGFTVWMAGGGLKPGLTYGATDELGFKVTENPVHVHDLHATILHLLGLDHERLVFPFGGLDLRLTDLHGKVVSDLIA